MALYEERREKRDELFSSLQVGQQVKGTVRSIAPFGIFIDLGGIDGLVHKSELSWNKVNSPEGAYEVGDEVEAEVIDINHERGRISLSIRRMQPDPWQSTVGDLKVGDLVDGTVTKIVNFGAFVRVKDGLEGLIHISELSHQRVAHPGDVVHEGQTLKLKVISLDSERHRLGPEPEAGRGGACPAAARAPAAGASAPPMTARRPSRSPRAASTTPSPPPSPRCVSRSPSRMPRGPTRGAPCRRPRLPTSRSMPRLPTSRSRSRRLELADESLDAPAADESLDGPELPSEVARCPGCRRVARRPELPTSRSTLRAPTSRSRPRSPTSRSTPGCRRVARAPAADESLDAPAADESLEAEDAEAAAEEAVATIAEEPVSPEPWRRRARRRRDRGAGQGRGGPSRSRPRPGGGRLATARTAPPP